jgi:energy-coupling factor transporter ATP-binding protein EcfA2
MEQGDSMAKQEQGLEQGALEAWFDGRPSWLRAAAQRLIDDRRLPNDSEIEALATHCFDEAAKCLAAPQPPLAPGAILGTAAGSGLRIDRISDIHDVNALGSKAQLDLSKSDLTVVYGANGSGKSGYARLVKHICGARAQEAMHGNVFLENSGAASALVRIRTSSAAEPSSPAVSTDLIWKASEGPLTRLRAIHVFDSPTAVQLNQSPNVATHLPRTMRFVGTLIDISDRVSACLKSRALQLVSQMPAIPSELSGTVAGNFAQGVSASLSSKSIDAACQFSESQRIERVTLEAALAQEDPAAAYAKVVGELERGQRRGSGSLLTVLEVNLTPFRRLEELGTWDFNVES